MQTIVTETIGHCSIYRPIALKFADMGVLKDIILMISEQSDVRSEFVKTACEAMWNIIEIGGVQTTETIVNESEVVFGLKTLFEKVLAEGYKLEDKLLRNELCILISYVAMSPKSDKYFLGTDPDAPDSHNFLDLITHDELGQNV